MSSDGRFGLRESSRVRTLGLALLVLVLLAGPLWVSMLDLTAPSYRYERVEVTADARSVAFVEGPETPHDIAVSEWILCSEPVVTRTCYLERSLLDGTVPADVYRSGPGETSAIEQSYEFVQTAQGIYEPTTATNRSQTYVYEDGDIRPVENGSTVDNPLYQVELTLTRVSGPTALQRVAIPVDSVDPIVREVARSGATTVHHRVEPPETPIELEVGTHYRVYLSEKQYPPETAGTAVSLLRFGAPITGLVLGRRLLDRFEIRHLGGD